MLKAAVQYGDFARLSMKTRVGYRIDFLLGSAGIVISNAISLGLIAILTSTFPSLGGWNFWELIFFYNLWLFGHGFYSTFFKNIENLPGLILSGDFDRFLLKPASPLVQVLGSQFYFFGAGDWVISSTMLVLCWTNLHLAFTLGTAALLVITILSSIIIETALALMINTLSFWFARTDALMSLVFQLNYTLVQRYPIDLYAGPLQILLTFVVPFAFMNFYPGVLLLGRADKILFHPLVHYLAPVMALILGFLALRFWSIGVKNYKSSGS